MKIQKGINSIPVCYWNYTSKNS